MANFYVFEYSSLLADSAEQNGNLGEQFIHVLRGALFAQIALSYTIENSEKIGSAKWVRELLETATKLLIDNKENKAFLNNLHSEESKTISDALGDIDDIAKSEDRRIVELAAQIRTLLVVIRDGKKEPKTANPGAST